MTYSAKNLLSNNNKVKMMQTTTLLWSIRMVNTQERKGKECPKWIHSGNWVGCALRISHTRTQFHK